MYCVYILENDAGGLYIGFTENLRNRLRAHQTGNGGRTTSLKKQWQLIYFEGYLIKPDALGREKFLKSGSGRKFLKKQLRNYFIKSNKLPTSS